MAEDIYSTLIGEAPTDAQKQRAVAEMLRRRRDFGELGAITGDRVLQPFGQNMIKEADDYAGQIQDTRQKDVAHGLQDTYQTGQLGHMKGTLDETIRNNDLEHQDRMAATAAMLEAARERAAAAAGGKPRKMTDTNMEKIATTVDTYEGIKDLGATFKPEFTQPFGSAAGLVGANYLPTALARTTGIGTENSKAAQDWWAKWNDIYTLPFRNIKFGATLSTNEKNEWKKVDINPQMDERQIRDAVQRINTILLRHATNKARVMISDHFDPEVVREAYGPMFEADQNVDDMFVTDEKHGAINRGPKQEKMIKVDAQGNVIE